MTRTCSTSQRKTSEALSWRKIARSKFYVGSLGSGTAPGNPQKEEALVSGFHLPDWDVHVPPDEPPRIDLSQLTKRQRQRRRECFYWDRVWRHAHQQLRRKWRLQRLKKAREFDELIEMYGYSSSSPEPHDAKQSRVPGVYPPQRRMRPRQGAGHVEEQQIAVVRLLARPHPCYEKKKQTCLIDSLRSLGVPVPYLEHGPFWALADGNSMLAPFGPPDSIYFP